MHRRPAFLAVLTLICAIAAPGCGGGGGSGTAGGSRAIAGTISGATAAGVTVKLSGAASRSATTDSSGAYSFTGLADGDYTVTASRSGYVFGPASRAATVSGTDLTGLDFSAAALLDDFGGSDLSAATWSSGQRQLAISGGAGVLSYAMEGLAADTTYSTSAVPVVSGEVTTWRADVKLTQATVTGDSIARAGIDLWFQPVADRLTAPDDQTGSLFARITLAKTESGLTAQRSLFECSSADCSTYSGVGTASGNWSSGSPPAVTVGSTYTLTVAVVPSTKVVTFSISGGDLSATYTETIDASAVVSPFAVDLSAANQYEARLFTAVRGGSSGGGSAASAATFDNVKAGIAGAAATLFDDFSSGTAFDASRWTVGADEVALVTGGLEVALTQAENAARLQVDVADPSTVAGMQADVKLTAYSHTGGGRIGARLAGTLYNDGTNGSGTAPDTNGASSEVGDVIAILSMTDTDVSYAVIRCDAALCKTGGYTFVKPFTSIGTVTSGTLHTLGWWWNAAAHTVYFQLDGGAAVGFDPTTAGSGFPVSKSAQVPFRQLGAAASDASASDAFSGGSGAVTTTFSEVGIFQEG